MVPSDLRLLRGIRELADGLEKTLQDPAQAEQAHTLSIILDELIKRQDGALYADLYAEGLALARAGQSIESGTAAAEMPAPVALARAGDTIQQHLHDLGVLLSAMIQRLSARPDKAIERWSDAVLDWEAKLWRPGPVCEITRDSATMELSHDRIEAYLEEVSPQSKRTLLGIRQIPGGFSKMTVLLEIAGADGKREDVVLRAQKPVAPFFMDGADIDNEFAALQFCHAAGLPVARPLWLEMDASKLGLPFLATSRIPGRNHGDFLGSSSQLPHDLVRNLIETMARVHAVPIHPEDPMLTRSHLGKWARHRSITAATRAYVEYWQHMAAKGGCTSSPALALGFAWLLANVPECNDPPVLVHGDFGLHNVMVEAGKVSGILDWEACYIGDPADEFFSFIRALSNTVTEAQILEWYAATGRTVPSLYRRRYYAVLSALKGPLTGIAAFNLVDRHPALDLKPLEVSYRFASPSLEQIGNLIKRAESAKSEDHAWST